MVLSTWTCSRCGDRRSAPCSRVCLDGDQIDPTTARSWQRSADRTAELEAAQ